MSADAIRVLHVIGGAGAGGMERHVADLARAQSAAGADVGVAAHASIVDGLAPGVRSIPLDLSRSRRRPDVLWALRRAVLADAPDVVHAHGSKAAAMVKSAMRAARGAPISVATAHGLKSDPAPYRGHAALIAVSNAAARRLKRDDAAVIPNGIDPPALPDDAGRAGTLSACGFDGAHPVALAVGRLAPVKGYDILLRSWRGLHADLAIAGDGPERAALEALAVELGVDDRVRFLGWRDDIPALLAGADLMVLSSRREGFPYTLVEALHVGTPVVATRVGVMAELLPEPALAEPENAPSLRAALDLAIRAPHALLKSFEPIFARARKEYTLDRMAARTLDVYRDALSSRARSR